MAGWSEKVWKRSVDGGAFEKRWVGVWLGRREGGWSVMLHVPYMSQGMLMCYGTLRRDVSLDGDRLVWGGVMPGDLVWLGWAPVAERHDGLRKRLGEVEGVDWDGALVAAVQRELKNVVLEGGAVLGLKALKLLDGMDAAVG